MYTNLGELQCHYKKHGTRNLHPYQSKKDIMEKHNEIWHWYKLLQETVLLYGTQPNPGQIFWTGMSCRLLFDSFTPRFWSPISTTSDREIASKFAQEGEGGIILRLKANKVCYERYFNPEVFSNYPDEKEKLFFRATQLEVMVIEYLIGAKCFNCDKFIPSFRLFSTIFDGPEIDQINQNL